MKGCALAATKKKGKKLSKNKLISKTTDEDTKDKEIK
jgi:hypothetical protein